MSAGSGRPPDGRGDDGRDRPPQPEEPAPTRDELLAMAYADGELAPDERRAFEARLAAEPALAREVAELRSLELLARRAAGPEPIDIEWRRIEASPLTRASRALAWSAIGLGALALAGWAALAVARSELDPAAKLGLLALAVGFAVLLLLALRARLRTRRYDPYREVRR